MAILTREEFASTARAKAGNIKLTGVVNESRKYAKSSAVTSIFLSHSHNEKNLVEQAKLFFENLGISIYVDWADDTMPDKPNAITAQKIKNQIISVNDKFVLIATNQAIASKWCNWELGIADPFKLYKKKMALLPIADNNRNWSGNEYLSIYPRIEQGTTDTNQYWVWYPDGTLETIVDWLKRT